ncbi:MAG: hypothetical protein KJO36_02525 [Acidimicrobiia bacterium]|nr:hypothetical protein [Acidimicrobiia bacterium]
MQRTALTTASILALALTACGSDGTSGSVPVTSAPPPAASTAPSSSAAPPASAGSTTTSDPSDVVVVSDIEYYESDTGDVAHLDVYHLPAERDLPLVVLFHSNPVFGGTKADEETLATMIAERGAVVVTPTYGSNLRLTEMNVIAREVLRWFRDQGPCAVWKAVELAPSFGADPSHLTVVGDVTGMGPAQMATFSPPSEIAGCAAAPFDAPVEKAILFETDWLYVPDIWDEVLAEDPAWFTAMTHWDDISDPNATNIYMLAGENSASNTVRSLNGQSYSESDWVALRDPDATLAEAWAASGALDDDEMSFTDVSQLATRALVDAGWDAEFMFVPGVSHSLSTTESKALIVKLIFDGG